MDAGRFAGIFAERPTEVLVIRDFTTIRVRVHVHVACTITQYLYIVHVYMYTCTRMHDAAIHVTCVLYMSTGPVASLKLRL